LIRHARLAAAATVLLLPIAMILSAFGTPLIPAIGAPPLLEPRGSAAFEAAISLSPMTVFTDPEHGVTAIVAANPLPQNHFAVSCHAHRRRGWTTTVRSCQLRARLM
jgi:hypothetical protein